MPGEVQVHYPASARVLTNTYLLHDIFTYSEAWEQRRSFLVACTTVCRPFYHSAIPLLWSNLVTLLPLWHLLAPANASLPFGHVNMQETNAKLAEFLLKVRFFLPSYSVSLAHHHEISGQLSAVISRSDTMEPLSLACGPSPSDISLLVSTGHMRRNSFPDSRCLQAERRKSHSPPPAHLRVVGQYPGPRRRFHHVIQPISPLCHTQILRVPRRGRNRSIDSQAARVLPVPREARGLHGISSPHAGLRPRSGAGRILPPS